MFSALNTGTSFKFQKMEEPSTEENIHLEEIDKLEGNIQNGTKEVIVQVPSGKFRITITNCSKLKMGFSKQPFAATVTSTGTFTDTKDNIERGMTWSTELSTPLNAVSTNLLVKFVANNRAEKCSYRIQVFQVYTVFYMKSGELGMGEQNPYQIPLSPGQYQLYLKSLNGIPFSAKCHCTGDNMFNEDFKDLTGYKLSKPLVVFVESSEQSTLTVNIVGTNPKEATFEFKILLSIGASELHIIKNYEKQVIVQQFRSMVDTAFQDESVEALGSIIEIINSKGANEGFQNILKYATKHRNALKKLLQKRADAEEAHASSSQSLEVMKKTLDDLLYEVENTQERLESNLEFNIREIETLLTESIRKIENEERLLGLIEKALESQKYDRCQRVLQEAEDAIEEELVRTTPEVNKKLRSSILMLKREIVELEYITDIGDRLNAAIEKQSKKRIEFLMSMLEAHEKVRKERDDLILKSSLKAVNWREVLEDHLQRAHMMLIHIAKVEKAIETVKKLIIQKNSANLGYCLTKHRELIPDGLFQNASTILFDFMHNNKVDVERFVAEIESDERERIRLDDEAVIEEERSFKKHERDVKNRLSRQSVRLDRDLLEDLVQDDDEEENDNSEQDVLKMVGDTSPVKTGPNDDVDTLESLLGDEEEDEPIKKPSSAVDTLLEEEKEQSEEEKSESDGYGTEEEEPKPKEPTPVDDNDGYEEESSTPVSPVADKNESLTKMRKGSVIVRKQPTSVVPSVTGRARSATARERPTITPEEPPVVAEVEKEKPSKIVRKPSVVVKKPTITAPEKEEKETTTQPSKSKRAGSVIVSKRKGSVTKVQSPTVEEKQELEDILAGIEDTPEKKPEHDIVKSPTKKKAVMFSDVVEEIKVEVPKAEPKKVKKPNVEKQETTDDVIAPKKTQVTAIKEEPTVQQRKSTPPKEEPVVQARKVTPPTTEPRKATPPSPVPEPRKSTPPMVKPEPIIEPKIDEEQLLASYVKETKQEEMVRKFQQGEFPRKKVTSHPLLDRLHSMILLMMQATGANVVTRNTPFSMNVLKTLEFVITNQTTMKFSWGWKERTLYDIFKNLLNQRVQKAIYYFEQQQFAKRDRFQSESMVFLQFILETGDFVPFMKILLDSRLYLDTCYDRTAIMSSPVHRDDLMCEIMMLQQFAFRLGYLLENTVQTPTVDAEGVVNSMKSTCRSVVKAFLEKKQKEGTVDEEFEERFSKLINDELILGIESLCGHGLKLKSMAEGYYTPWQIFEAFVLRQSQVAPSTMLTSKVAQAVAHVNQTVTIKESELPFKNRIKFCAFIVYSLNNKILGENIEMVMKNEEVVRHFCQNSSIFNDAEKTDKIISYLNTLAKLPFKLGQK